MALSAEEEYVESGYFVDDDYVGGIADATVIFGGYFEEGADYVETDYILDQSVVVGLTVTLGEVKTAESLLDYLASLNAQAEFTASGNISVTSSFTMGHEDDGSISPNVEPNAAFEGAADFTTAAGLSAAPLTVIESDSITIGSSASLSADAIEYRLRGADRVENTRPLVPADSNLSGAFPTGNQVKFGSNASQLLDSNTNYLEYQDSVLVLDNSDEWVFETYITGGVWTATNHTSEIITIAESNYTSVNDIQFRLQVVESGANDVLRISYDESDGTNASGTGSTDLSTSTKHHILVAWNPGTGFKVYLNGSVEITESFTGDIKTLSDPSVWIGYAGIESGTGTGAYFWLDETRILAGSSAFSDAGLTYSSSSFTEPTGAYSSNDSTQLLLHYEGDYRDDDIGVQLFTSSISSSAGISVDAIKLVDGSSSISSSAGFSSSGDRIRSSSASVDSSFSISSTPSRTQQGSGSLASSASVTSSAGIIFSADVEFDSVASKLTSAARTADFFVNADSAFSLSVDGTVDSTGSVSIDSSTSISASGERLRFADAAPDSVATLSASGDRSRVGSASIDSAFTVGADAVVILGLVETLNSSFGITADVEFIPGVVATMDSGFGQTAGGVVSAVGGADFASSISINALGGALFEASANFPAISAVISVNKILRIDQYVYKIPTETRVFKIKSEDRSYSIPQETRTYKIKGA